MKVHDGYDTRQALAWCRFARMDLCEWLLCGYCLDAVEPPAGSLTQGAECPQVYCLARTATR